MYDPQDDELFGRDWRHRPPPTVQLTEEKGWGSSHGRLAYSSMVRTHELNVSEYAIRMTGGVPKGYVIVDAHSMTYNPDTALKVAHGRVAIPVKEFARMRNLTIREQWELMNPQWVGTYFGEITDTYKRRRPDFVDALTQARKKNEEGEFLAQFWNAYAEHFDAFKRLERRAKELQLKADGLHDELMVLERKIQRIESDIHYQRYTEYHLEGYNVHEYLDTLRMAAAFKRENYQEAQQRADKIKNYIKDMTY